MTNPTPPVQEQLSDEQIEGLLFNARIGNAPLYVQALTELQSRRSDDSTGSRAASDIIAERQRQIEVEGWDAAHDDQHRDGSMALAAACYAMFASVSDAARRDTDMPGGLTTTGKSIPGWAAWLEIWPWDRKWWKPKTRRHDLVRAAALIIAEIERLERAAGISDDSGTGSRKSAPQPAREAVEAAKPSEGGT